MSADVQVAAGAAMPRGIRELGAFGLDGAPVLIAVDSRGLQVGQWSPPPSATDVAWCALEALLNVVDPPLPVRAQLSLVGDTAARPRWTSRAQP